MQPTVVIVDDEDGLREAVVEYLNTQGLHTLEAPSAQAFRQLIDQQRVDVAVLDIAMPGEDGLSLARWLREHHSVGIIFATAAGRQIDRIVGLEIGADDYVVKPYDLRELLARIRSVLRRIKTTAAAKPDDAIFAASKRVQIGALALDSAGRRLTTAAGEAIDLTAMEFDLLEVLATRPNRILSRAQLLELAHSRASEDGDRSIDIRITRIRKKIEPDPERPRYIRTVRGEGYVFVPDEV
jgi:two-component system phosphate regulon response regulator OmpR